MFDDRQETRFQQFSRNRNLISLRDDSETHRTAVDASKLKLDKLNEKKEKLRKWKDEKQMQKMLQKASEKLVFKCEIVRHNVGSPYNNTGFGRKT